MRSHFREHICARVGRSSRRAITNEDDDEQDERHIVEDVLDSRQNAAGAGKEFLVKWEGYDS